MKLNKQFITAQEEKVTARVDVYTNTRAHYVFINQTANVKIDAHLCHAYDETADIYGYELTYTLYSKDGVHYTLKGYSNGIYIQDEYNAKMLLNAKLKDIYALITMHVYNTAL